MNVEDFRKRQITVEELNTTSDEMESRTLELQSEALRGEPLAPERFPFELATRCETFEMKVTIETTNGKSGVNKISGKPAIVTSAPWVCVVTIRSVK